MKFITKRGTASQTQADSDMGGDIEIDEKHHRRPSTRVRDGIRSQMLRRLVRQAQRRQIALRETREKRYPTRQRKAPE